MMWKECGPKQKQNLLQGTFNLLIEGQINEKESVKMNEKWNNSRMDKI